MDITSTSGIIPYIENRIFTIRGLQVMLDSDLAELYGVETKMINRAVKRNPDRFPEEFYFSLTNEESDFVMISRQNVSVRFLRYQNGTLETSQRGKHRKYLPKVFTEQGVAMLASALRSDAAIKVSVQIVKTFVAMRRFLINHEMLFEKLAMIDLKFLESDQKFQQIFKALETRNALPETGIFFEGKVFDAWAFVSDLVRSAKHSILLIDNYIDDTVLKLFTKRAEGVTVKTVRLYDCTTVRLCDFLTLRLDDWTIRQLDESRLRSRLRSGNSERILVIAKHF
jgi:phage regulator Rha-like protein